MIKQLKFKGEGEKFWFSSDWHFFHNPPWNVPIWKMRGFNSVGEMNYHILKNINEKVKHDDTMFFLGDGFLNATKEGVDSILNQINCQTIYYLWGNHESVPLHIYKEEIKNNYGEGVEVYPYRYKNLIFAGNDLSVIINGQMIVMSHFAKRIWSKSHHSAWSLSGHSHFSDKDRHPNCKNSKSLDVGIDGQIAPYSFSDLQRIMAKKEILRLDHHDENVN